MPTASSKSPAADGQTSAAEPIRPAGRRGGLAASDALHQAIRRISAGVRGSFGSNPEPGASPVGNRTSPNPDGSNESTTTIRRVEVIDGRVIAVTRRPRADGVLSLIVDVECVRNPAGSRDAHPNRAGDVRSNSVVELVWFGRRRILGIVPGGHLRARGLVTEVDGKPTMFNPAYELVIEGNA